MARNITMNQLTEGIRERHLGTERNRLMEKWNRTGLLRGMDDYGRETMSQLLENQAAQLLREANTLGSSAGNSGTIDGFSNIAFPIVRRVFGGLVANDLVSIQPMSLPSGLLFYLDYSYGSNVGGEDTNTGNSDLDETNAAGVYRQGQSLYGIPDGRDIQSGANAVGGQYDLAGSTYSKVYGKAAFEDSSSGNPTSGVAGTGKLQGADTNAGSNDSFGAYTAAGVWTSAQALETTNSKNLFRLSISLSISVLSIVS